MEKKAYMAPEAEIMEIKALTMVATSIGIGEGEADAWQSFSNEYRGPWGNQR